jgi:hypothetical protein
MLPKRRKQGYPLPRYPVINACTGNIAIRDARRGFSARMLPGIRAKPRRHLAPNLIYRQVAYSS